MHIYLLYRQYFITTTGRFKASHPVCKFCREVMCGMYRLSLSVVFKAHLECRKVYGDETILMVYLMCRGALARPEL